MKIRCIDKEVAMVRHALNQLENFSSYERHVDKAPAVHVNKTPKPTTTLRQQHCLEDLTVHKYDFIVSSAQ